MNRALLTRRVLTRLNREHMECRQALRRLLRYVVAILLLPAVFLLLARLVPFIAVASYLAALAFLLVLGLLNALLRPLIVRLTLPLSVYTVGLFSLVVSAFLIWLASLLVPGVRLTSLWGAALCVIFLAVLVSLADRWAAGPDYGPPWRLIRRFQAMYRAAPKSTTPGVLFLEIDGLAEPILRRAVEAGHMPTLARWLRGGSHRLMSWEAGLPSQTSACQAGILHGNNWDIPAFRWYEKDRSHLMVSGHPPDAHLLNSRISNGQGLLHRNGVSIDNNVDGDAPDCIVTMSMVQDSEGHLMVGSKDFTAFFADANAYLQALGRTGWEAAVEVYEAWRQRRRNVKPRINRGGFYPLVRALTTGALVDITVYSLTEHMFKGIDVAYATFVAYDEVAHHSGPETPDALRVLRMLDHRFSRLEQVARHTPRPYRFVLLSDHGQSHGATFRQRQDRTLAELVQALVTEGNQVAPVVAADEGIGHASAFLTEALRSRTVVGQVGRHAFQNRIRDGFVDLRPEQRAQAAHGGDGDANVVVCPSGNLGLIYFADVSGRLTLEQINERFPNLIDALRSNSWIGYLMVRSGEHGPMVLGRSGTHYLERGNIEGDDPLALFGSTAADHLRRLDQFPHTADIVVNSFYNPTTGEVAAFEELVGSHGGLGGLQNQPFLLYPSDWNVNSTEIVGAENVFAVLAGWL